ncbi:hypothetical protein, partial [Clostridioides difficile]|nr:translation elongation factor G [Clostridioides difficile]
MDAPGTDSDQLIQQIQQTLSPGCVAFNTPGAGDTLEDRPVIPTAAVEDIAMQNDEVLTDYLETGTLSDATIRQMIQRREVFPCYFGAALKLDGV